MNGLFDGFLDDAAVFPPGSLSPAKAVPAHRRHLDAAYAPLVGPLVLPPKDVDAHGPIGAGAGSEPLRLALTTLLPRLADVIDAVDSLPTVELVAIEIALPDHLPARQVVPALDHVLKGRHLLVFVELPRDARRTELISGLRGTRYQAKLRTGGVRADLYPDEQELAAAIVSLVSAGVPYKATAGLHHALRNTDSATGFEQHGFLNLLVATDAAASGAGEAEVARILGERDDAAVASDVRHLQPGVRDRFRSIGTCSIVDPVTELDDLGLLDPIMTEDFS